MGRVREQREPEDSVIARNIRGKIDYMDCFCIDMKGDHAVTADYLAVKLFAFSPGWIRFLVKIRNILVKPFGISTVTDHEPEEADKSVRYNIGEKAGIFTVSDRTGSEIVLAGDDIHLYFRISVLLMKNTLNDYDTVFITTLVQFHNALGRMYFIPVKPFHRIIVKSMLKRLA